MDDALQAVGGGRMSYRTAADAAYMLVHEEDKELAQFGFDLLTRLAVEDCYSARLNMMHLYEMGGARGPNIAMAEMWAKRAKALHATLTDPDDLYDAGVMCASFGSRFDGSASEALDYWARSAGLGNGLALYAICDLTRSSHGGTIDWIQKLTTAAELGCCEAMVELSGQEGVRGTAQEILWLRAAAALGSLRAKEMLEA